MILLTRLGGKPFYLNDDLIESLESTPDTTILLTTGKRVIVHEPPEEVLRRIIAFRQRVYGPGTDEPNGPRGRSGA